MTLGNYIVPYTLVTACLSQADGEFSQVSLLFLHGAWPKSFNKHLLNKWINEERKGGRKESLYLLSKYRHVDTQSKSS